MSYSKVRNLLKILSYLSIFFIKQVNGKVSLFFFFCQNVKTCSCLPSIKIFRQQTMYSDQNIKNKILAIKNNKKILNVIQWQKINQTTDVIIFRIISTQWNGLIYTKKDVLELLTIYCLFFWKPSLGFCFATHSWFSSYPLSSTSRGLFWSSSSFSALLLNIGVSKETILDNFSPFLGPFSRKFHI